MEAPNYRSIYDEFIASYSAGVTNAEEVGFVITKLAQHFCDANMSMGQADEAFNKKFAQIMELEEGGKSITAAKAKVLVDASDESRILKTAKIKLENIEQLINALKYLQKGMTNEYSSQ